jgi:hypothetical protein
MELEALFAAVGEAIASGPVSFQLFQPEILAIAY